MKNITIEKYNLIMSKLIEKHKSKNPMEVLVILLEEASKYKITKSAVIMTKTSIKHKDKLPKNWGKVRMTKKLKEFEKKFEGAKQTE